MGSLAVAVEFLISSGHASPEKYTIRQLLAFYGLATQRRNSELVNLLGINRVAYHGAKQDVKKVVKGLENG